MAKSLSKSNLNKINTLTNDPADHDFDVDKFYDFLLQSSGSNDELKEFNSKINNKDYKLSPDDFYIEKIFHPKKEGIGTYKILDPTTKNLLGEFPFHTYKIPLDYSFDTEFDDDYLQDDELKNKLLNILKKNKNQDMEDWFAPMDNLIKLNYPEIHDKLKGRGLGNQIYSLIEKDSGKKIMPDTILTRHSENLHKNYGLGKKFGSDNYKDTIIEAQRKALKKISEKIEDDSVEKLTDVEINKLADATYKKLKNNIGHYLPDFKSVVPTFIKGLGAGAAAKTAAALATGGASLTAQAVEEGVDSTLANENEDQQVRLMRMQEGIRKARENNPQMKNIFEKGDEELKSYGSSNLIDPKENPDIPKFKKLLNKINRK